MAETGFVPVFVATLLFVNYSLSGAIMLLPWAFPARCAERLRLTRASGRRLGRLLRAHHHLGRLRLSQARPPPVSSGPERPRIVPCARLKGIARKEVQHEIGRTARTIRPNGIGERSAQRQLVERLAS